MTSIVAPCYHWFSTSDIWTAFWYLIKPEPSLVPPVPDLLSNQGPNLPDINLPARLAIPDFVATIL